MNSNALALHLYWKRITRDRTETIRHPRHQHQQPVDWLRISKRNRDIDIDEAKSKIDPKLSGQTNRRFNWRSH